MTRYRILAVFLAVLLLGAAALGAFLIQTGRMPWEARRGATLKAISTDAARRDVDAVLRAAPDYAPFFAALGAAYPNDHERLIAKFASRRALAGSSESADLYVTDAVSSLSQTRGSLAARAAAPELDAIFASQAKVAAALAGSDARLCVDFIYGNTSQGYFDFAGKHRPLIAEMARAGLNAIVNGAKSKIERGPPTEADLALFEKALSASGLARPEIEAFIDGKPPDPPISDTRLCQAGRTYFDVLRGLDEPVRMRLYGHAVELMAHS